LAILGACLALSGAASVQAAQTPATDDELDEVVVTGSSIRGVKAVGQPVVEVTREEIEAAGVSNLSQIARTLPVVLNLGPDESRTGGAQDAAANATRISAINLRGLGPESTLLLVNGRRTAPGGILRALSDPSMIAAGATERLEVVLDGNSAVYGADAVAGVVNIITRRDYDGAETRLRYGAGDGLDEKQVSQSFGRNWGSGYAFITGEWSNRSDLARADRASFLTADLRPYGRTDQRSTQARTPNLVVGAGANAPRYQWPALTTPAARFDGLEGDFLPEQRRINGFWAVHQDLNQDVEVWYEGFLSRRRVISDGQSLGASFSVPRTNAFYPTTTAFPGLTGIGVTSNTANRTVEYRLPRPGARSKAKELAQQHAAGLTWKLPADWQLSSYVSYSTDSAVSGLGGEQINNKTLPLALADSNPATALNVFGGPISDAVYNRFIAFRHQINDAKATHYEAKLDGPLFPLPGGAVRGAVGVSHERSSLRYQEYQSALSDTNTPSTTNDKTTRRQTTSAYAEVFVPIVGGENAMRGVQRLDLSLAMRHDDYSDFGGTTNPKIAAVWSPGGGLNLRATWGKSFRAPSLVDIGNLNFAFITDGADPANPPNQIRQLLITGSNPNLNPEKAETFSYGFDYQPTFLPDFSTSLTYYKVDYTDRILGIAASLANEAQYRQFITRNPPLATVQAILDSGVLVSTPQPANTIGVLIDGRRNNIGTLKQDGIDLDVRYRLNTKFGTWSTSLQHSRIFHIKQVTTPGGPTLDVVDTFNNPIADRGRVNLGWMSGPWSANVFYNYAGDYLNTAITPNVKAESQETVDLNLAFSVPKGDSLLEGVRVAFNLQNLTDRDPPIVLNGANIWDNTSASLTGRYFSVDLSKSW
jgi:iron complex outermembrane receptor protein